ncbi:hypothetical protein [Helicobacter pylori]|uniref:Uncharacterized protein n=1 Tax=Helicobacter pylori GAM260BSi TaxID=1159046 RepID=M3Q240_HELPX|nr:hypothetical protein [Helicobacter pylori]EMH25710.1 hypothetical protein HMPREF1418_00196 [Helicobacter pylori GAM260BSi]EMH69872.1 hypothetical protein HMPREF1451_00166 [Helicobacter pylori HP260BFii]NHA86749.1 hypothetical protein [Helicobacter pylori]NHA90887.1 hypothetical protein [Helicobacter pylori]QEF24506.1 hypothetical protein D2C85_07220 [Helicobacter pylori]
MAFMRKSYGAVSVDNVTIKSIKAKLGSNHYHKVSGSHQVGGAHKVISSFNAQKPFFIRQHLKGH